MSAALSRILMSMALCCLPPERRDWALAMEGEFAAATQDGRALSFAIGCLLAAWRELPAHPPGRLLVGRHALALGLLVPISALLLSGALFGLADPGHVLNDGNRAAAPVLWQLIAAIGAMRLGVAWAMLDRDWARVAALERLSAASVVALIVFAAIATLDASRALLPMMTLIPEWVVATGLARLHDEPLAGDEAYEQG